MTVFSCPRCGVVSNKKAIMINHINRQTVCDPIYNNIKLDIADIDTYITKNPFQCTMCPKTFSTQYSLDIHMKNTCKIIKQSNKKEELKKEKENISLYEYLNKHLEKFIKQTQTQTQIQTQKKKKISAALRYKVWNEYIGQEYGIYKCLCCLKTNISQQSFECGHILAESSGGTSTIENLRPICSLCNLSMNTTNMFKFQMTLF